MKGPNKVFEIIFDCKTYDYSMKISTNCLKPFVESIRNTDLYKSSH